MTTAARIIAAAFGAALCLAVSAGLSAAAPWSMQTVKPATASSYDAGREHIVSYFLNEEGVCKLTLLISEVVDEAMTESDGRVTRLQFSVEPGRAASLEAADGKAMRFACLGRAQSMSVTKTDRLALYPVAQ